MKQKDIIKYYEDNGGLRCKYWTIKEISSLFITFRSLEIM